MLGLMLAAATQAASPAAPPVAKAAPAATVVQRRGFAIDWQGAAQTPAVAASLETQIGMVEQAPVSAAVMAFFRAQPITVYRPGERSPDGGPARAGPNGVFFARTPNPPDNPVLLHELIHRWHMMRMPGGYRNAEVRRFYNEASASGLWPRGSYMLKNPVEFLAMTASVVIHGRAARPPFTREAVRTNAPDLYSFILREFGYTGPA